MRYQNDFVGTKNKLDVIISYMVNYFQTPRHQSPVVSCEDACLRLQWGQHFRQIDHSARNECYIRLPATITPRFSDSDMRRQDVFIATCFWNKHGISPEDSHYTDLCYSTLALAGTGALLPSCAVGLVGSGENGKTRWAQSKIRLFGGEDGGCDFVDSRVLFDQHEWRINMGNFLNFLGIIFDEAGDASAGGGKFKQLEASLIKLLIDRKKVMDGS